MMNCKELAGELLDLRLRMLHEPAEQILVSFHKGGQFVLDYLANQKNGISPQKNISRDMIVSSARITVLLKNLEEKGYIRRMKDPFDSRQELVSITESGRDAIGRLRDVLIQHGLRRFSKPSEVMMRRNISAYKNAFLN